MKVKDIQKGDSFADSSDNVIWTAIENAELIDAEELTDYGPKWCSVKVIWAYDGVKGSRVYDDPEIDIPIRRDG